MKVEEKILKNGAKIIGVSMPGSNSVVVNFGFRTGSRNEDPYFAGISHFLEHMVFKGSGKRPTTAIIAKAADSIGASYNAMTDKEWTQYYIHTSKANFDLALDIYGDMVTKPLLEQKEIDKEVGTIIEELKMYKDTPIMEIGWRLEETMFGHNTPLGRDEGGTEETVRRIDAIKMRDYYEKFYTAGNCVTVVAGDLPDDYIEKVSSYLERLSAGSTNYLPIGKLSSSHLNVIEKDTEQAHLGICLPEFSVNDENKYATKVAAVILGGNMSSRLFSEVREKRGLAYAISANIQKYSDTGAVEIMGGIKKEKVLEAIEIINNQLTNFSKTLTQEEVTSAIGFLEGMYSIRFDDPEARATFIATQNLVSKAPETPEEFLGNIKKVTLEQVKKLSSQIFDVKKSYVTVIGPFKDKEKFAKILAE